MLDVIGYSKLVCFSLCLFMDTFPTIFLVDSVIATLQDASLELSIDEVDGLC